jgi:CHASE2 domain-containing sensor protein
MVDITHRGPPAGDYGSVTGVKLTAFRVGLLSTFVVVLLYVFTAPSTLLRNLEAKALDLRFHLRGSLSPTPRVRLIVIDDRSIAELGHWPWSRQRFADILYRLWQAGAKIVTFDLLFSEPEVAVERDMLRRLRQAIASSGPAAPGSGNVTALAQQRCCHGTDCDNCPGRGGPRPCQCGA